MASWNDKRWRECFNTRKNLCDTFSCKHSDGRAQEIRMNSKQFSSYLLHKYEPKTDPREQTKINRRKNVKLFACFAENVSSFSCLFCINNGEGKGKKRFFFRRKFWTKENVCSSNFLMAFLRDIQVNCLNTNGHIYDVYSLTCIYFFNNLLEGHKRLSRKNFPAGD